jgi:hypothetical protein
MESDIIHKFTEWTNAFNSINSVWSDDIGIQFYEKYSSFNIKNELEYYLNDVSTIYDSIDNLLNEIEQL